MFDNPNDIPDFEITEAYMKNLEQMISVTPQYWLWSHNRWKRTKEEFLKRQEL
jgi:KDO2-lipid IV(A) lauroyltransferase